MSRKIFTVLVVICLAAVATLSLAGPSTGVRGGDRDRVAVISVKDFNLEKLEGKVVLMAFWAGRDCVVCPSFISWLHQMQGRYGEDGLVVVAVNVDRESAAASDLLNSIHPRSQVVLDPQRRLVGKYEVEGIPSTYLFDRNLNQAKMFRDFVPKRTQDMEDALQDLIEKKYQD